MTYPLVSLIIPCRNEESFISACLNSILENDFPKDKIEIVVSDGLSTDETLNIVRNFIY